MRTLWVSVIVFLASLLGCVSATQVRGPDGSEHQLVRCTDSEDCYTKATEICGGSYQLVESGARTAVPAGYNGVWSGSSKEMLVRCGESQTGKEASSGPAPVRHQVKATDDAPKDAAGFTFGTTVEDVQQTCATASFEWREEGSNFRCTGTPVDTGLEANSVRPTFGTPGSGLAARR